MKFVTTTTTVCLISFAGLLLFSCSGKKVVHPEYKDIVEAVYASGTILPKDEYRVFALSNGIIIEKKVKDGDEIKAGQILYEVSNTTQTAMLNAAQTTVDNSEQNISGNSPVLNDLKLAMQSAEAKFLNDSMMYVRYANLLKESAVSKTIYDNAKLNYEISLNQKKSSQEKYLSTKNQLQLVLSNAKSQLAATEEGLNNYIIKSDSNGTVFQTFKEKGEAVRPGELIALLGKKNARIIRLSIDQQDISKVKTGQEVLLKTDVTGKNIYAAHVVRIYPVMKESDQSFRVDAVFPDSVVMPYVHSSVEANIIIEKKNHTLVIPRSLLVSEESVLVKTGKEIKTVPVKTGLMTLDDVEIISGIDENSELVLPSTNK